MKLMFDSPSLSRCSCVAVYMCNIVLKVLKLYHHLQVDLYLFISEKCFTPNSWFGHQTHVYTTKTLHIHAFHYLKISILGFKVSSISTNAKHFFGDFVESAQYTRVKQKIEEVVTSHGCSNRKKMALVMSFLSHKLLCQHSFPLLREISKWRVMWFSGLLH